MLIQPLSHLSFSPVHFLVCHFQQHLTELRKQVTTQSVLLLSSLFFGKLSLVVLALVFVQLAHGVVGLVAVLALMLLDARVALEVDLVAVAGGVGLAAQVAGVWHVLGVRHLQVHSTTSCP